MNDKNNIHLEGLIIDCTIERTTETNKPYANLVIGTIKNVNGNKEKSFHRARFPITKSLEKQINTIADECSNNRNSVNKTASELVTRIISIDGELHSDLKGQPFIFADCDDVRFPDKLSKENNAIRADGKVKSILKATPVAATVLMELSGKDGSKTTLPVNVSAKNNPTVWAAISSGEIKKNDTMSVTGKADGRLYGDGKNVLFQILIQAETIKLQRKQAENKKMTSSLG